MAPEDRAADDVAGARAPFDDLDADALQQRLGVPRLEVYDAIGSTLDRAHLLGAARAPAGTLIVADRQTSGRGRQGRVWDSPAGQGVWCSTVERDLEEDAIDVLSLRVGLALAEALEPLAGVRVGLKWPNDLYVDGRKLGGILIETRWRHARPDWIAVGIGINVRAPGLATATGLPDTVDRVTVLSAVVAAVRRAVGASGGLTTTELDAWSARDIAVGRECREPALGTVHGIDVDGALVVRTAAGLATFRAGSLVLTDGTA